MIWIEYNFILCIYCTLHENSTAWRKACRRIIRIISCFEHCFKQPIEWVVQVFDRKEQRFGYQKTIFSKVNSQKRAENWVLLRSEQRAKGSR